MPPVFWLASIILQWEWKETGDQTGRKIKTPTQTESFLSPLYFIKLPKEITQQTLVWHSDLEVVFYILAKFCVKFMHYL